MLRTLNQHQNILESITKIRFRILDNQVPLSQVSSLGCIIRNANLHLLGQYSLHKHTVNTAAESV